jgi:Mrp family chromosome partitioning ATPase
VAAKGFSKCSQVINAASMSQLLDWARTQFSWVVLDAAPVTLSAGVVEVACLADAVLLVLRAQHTPRELTRRAFELLGKNLCGVVFNEATIESSPYYRYLK